MALVICWQHFKVGSYWGTFDVLIYSAGLKLKQLGLKAISGKQRGAWGIGIAPDRHPARLHGELALNIHYT